MKIVNIFNSIQGEGRHMGIPCTFVRTFGCNLKCPWCDELSHRNPSLATDMTLSAIADRCMHKLVIITGGEPTLQYDELQQLIRILKARGHIVAIESNGSCEGYDKLDCYVVVSPKAERMYSFFPNGVDELKYVVTEDFNADVAIPESVRAKFEGRIWLQPCDTGGDSIKQMWKKCYAIAMLDDRLRVGVQLHKLMEVQ